MTQKSKVDAVIREFIDNCKYVPVTAVTSIIGQLGAIADSLDDDDEYRKEQLAVGVSHIASGMDTDDKPKPMLTNTTMLWIGKRIDELQNTKRDVVMGYRHEVNILTLEAELNTLQRIIRMEEGR